MTNVHVFRLFQLCIQVQSLTLAPKLVDQTLNTSILDTLDAINIFHTVVFPEGRTLSVSVEYRFIPIDSYGEGNVEDDLEHTIETIDLYPSTDVTK